MNFNVDESSIPQISEAVATAIEQAEHHIEAGDVEQARTILWNAENAATNADEFGAVAGAILNGLGNREWGKAVLTKAIERATSATSTAMLAGYALQAEESGLVQTIMQTAETRTTSLDDAMGAVAIALNFGDDQNIIESFYRKAEASASTCGDFLRLAEGTAFIDEERTRKYLERALTLAGGPEDREAVATAIEEHVGDDEWASTIRTQ